MRGFEYDNLPDWVAEAFDERTTLPRGPLDRFPVPLGGRIISARSIEPKDGRPSHWAVVIKCCESTQDTLAFYEEYLPLAGYAVTASGWVPHRRDFTRPEDPPCSQLVLIERAYFVGSVLIHSEVDEQYPTAYVEMGDRHHPFVQERCNVEQLRKNPVLRWRKAP